ncbi:MAG: hypothetical protein QXV46_04580, partial [Candidatus Bathyarchaeia archaeon]
LIDVGGIVIIPKHIWKDISDWRTFQPDREPHPKVKGLTKMVGTGPFILAEEKPGEFWRLRANPNYFKRFPAVKTPVEGVGLEEWSLNLKTLSLIAIPILLVLIGYLMLRRRVSRRI